SPEAQLPMSHALRPRSTSGNSGWSRRPQTADPCVRPRSTSGSSSIRGRTRLRPMKGADLAKVKTGETMRSASRLLQVLSSFTLDRPAKTITEISRELDLSATTVRRLLLTLESQGFVRHDPDTARYCLHYEIIRLAAVASETSSLIDVSAPTMEELRYKTEETVQLAVRNGTDVVFIANRHSPLQVRIFHPVGWRHPTY